MKKKKKNRNEIIKEQRNQRNETNAHDKTKNNYAARIIIKGTDICNYSLLL